MRPNSPPGAGPRSESRSGFGARLGSGQWMERVEGAREGEARRWGGGGGLDRRRGRSNSSHDVCLVIVGEG